MDRSNYDKTEQCSPIDTVTTASYGNVNVYPCGLIAWSAINDTIYGVDNTGGVDYLYTDHITVLNAGETTLSATTATLVPTTSNGIAWSSDKDEKFQRLTTCPGNQASPATATVLTPSIAMPYNTYKYYMCSDGQAPCAIAQTFATATAGTGIALTEQCVDATAPSTGSFAYGTTAGAVKTTCQEQNRCGDVGNEEFIVWMRTSGLPTFRKLHRVINTDLKKGQTVVFYVNDVFPVTKFDGTKKIVLSTTTWIGGKNTFLGAAYISVACICILLGVGFLIKELLSPKTGTEIQS
jgi:hypothetical protein